MRSRFPLLASPIVVGLVLASGCGPQQEYNSTETVKTQLPATKPAGKVVKPVAAKPQPRSTSAKPIAD